MTCNVNRTFACHMITIVLPLNDFHSWLDVKYQRSVNWLTNHLPWLLSAEPRLFQIVWKWRQNEDKATFHSSESTPVDLSVIKQSQMCMTLRQRFLLKVPTSRSLRKTQVTSPTAMQTSILTANFVHVLLTRLVRKWRQRTLVFHTTKAGLGWWFLASILHAYRRVTLWTLNNCIW